MIVCLCRGVSDKVVADAIVDGACTVEEVSRRCGAGTGCGSCVPMLAEMIEDAGACDDCTRVCQKRLLSPYLADGEGKRAA